MTRNMEVENDAEKSRALMSGKGGIQQYLVLNANRLESQTLSLPGFAQER